MSKLGHVLLTQQIIDLRSTTRCFLIEVKHREPYLQDLAIHGQGINAIAKNYLSRCIAI